MTPDQERWAEALAIDRIHGNDAPHWIAERVGQLAQEGDMAGAQRFIEIAECFEQLLAARRRPQ